MQNDIESGRERRRVNIPRLLVAVLTPQLVGAASGLATAGAVQGWYQTLVRPSYAPPAWVFGPVWTLLYLMMGLAAYLVWQRAPAPGVRLALGLFVVQLALNGLWSLLFFGLESPGLALVEIIILWLAIGATVITFRRVRPVAAGLLLPYWAWVTFATILNYGFWSLNRGG